MFYEQLKPSEFIHHCTSVLKYTRQFLPADISQASASGWVSKLPFQTAFMLCLLFPYFLTQKKKKKKKSIPLFEILSQAGPQYFKGILGSQLHEETYKLPR